MAFKTGLSYRYAITYSLPSTVKESPRPPLAELVVLDGVMSSGMHDTLAAQPGLRVVTFQMNVASKSAADALHAAILGWAHRMQGQDADAGRVTVARWLVELEVIE